MLRQKKRCVLGRVAIEPQRREVSKHRQLPRLELYLSLFERAQPRAAADFLE